MMRYWVKTRGWIRFLFPGFVWKIITCEKIVYLTFDDGPAPGITPWVLETLERYGAKATFFCIGNNIRKNPKIFKQVKAAGHAIGNHTFNHLNGWHTGFDAYLENVRLCEREIGLETNLFRPPYGKVTRKVRRALAGRGYKLVMWDVLSADFDQNITPEKCFDNVARNIEAGSIIIFHDSQKAAANLRYALPRTLEMLKEKGFRCEKLAL